ncbi:hypothetical protein TNCV_1896691 [Trichonephila clavipes]|nr:hypothetical protein TNCV_1896691 [Trichonephila clavipes]
MWNGDTLNIRRAANPLVKLVEGEERWKAPKYPQGFLQNWGKTESNRTVTYMVLKSTNKDRFNRLEYIKLCCRNSNLGHHTGQANAVRGINADQIRCSQLASLDKNNALWEIKLRLSYLQGKSTTMSVIAHQIEKEWISANEKSRQRMSQTQAEGAAKQHAARLEEAHLRAHHSCFTTSERC